MLIFQMLLEDLRERYKSLVMAGQANTEEASRLRDAIVQLDARIKETDARAWSDSSGM